MYLYVFSFSHCLMVLEQMSTKFKWFSNTFYEKYHKTQKIASSRNEIKYTAVIEDKKIKKDQTTTRNYWFELCWSAELLPIFFMCMHIVRERQKSFSVIIRAWCGFNLIICFSNLDLFDGLREYQWNCISANDTKPTGDSLASLSNYVNVRIWYILQIKILKWTHPQHSQYD